MKLANWFILIVLHCSKLLLACSANAEGGDMLMTSVFLHNAKMSIINRVLCANLKCYQRSFTTAFSQKYPPPLQKSFSFNFVRESKVQAQRSLSLGRGLRVPMEAKKSKGNGK